MSGKSKGEEFLNKLRVKQLEVSSVPVQNLGQFNSVYKSFATYFKVDPWRVIIPLSILSVIAFKLLTGFSLVNLVSFLQEGF